MTIDATVVHAMPEAPRTGPDGPRDDPMGDPRMRVAMSTPDLLPLSRRMVRLCAMAVAEDACQSSLAALDDLRAAVDELLGVVSLGGVGPMAVDITSEGPLLHIALERESGGVHVVGRLSRDVLDAVVDHWHADVVAGRLHAGCTSRCRTR